MSLQITKQGTKKSQKDYKLQKCGFRRPQVPFPCQHYKFVADAAADCNLCNVQTWRELQNYRKSVRKKVRFSRRSSVARFEFVCV